ncbi:MAG: hypothetical protein H6733_14660 [Alphaproteobacteria bacterium]|nr:hypothetical protein [Alphaproteobacteria bacterium]
MLALMLALVASTAQAGTLRATVRIDDGQVTVVRATALDGDVPATEGVVEVMGADGTVLSTGALPPLLTFRSVLTPDGGSETVRVDSPWARVALPWPEGATGLRFTDDGPVAPVLAQQGFDPGNAIAVLSSGPSDRRLDLVFFSEGYADGEQARFDADVDRVVDHMTSVEPWATYQGMLNTWKVWLPSADSGIDPSPDQDVADTVFGCHYNCALGGQAVSRLICCDEETVLDVIDSEAPFADGVMVLANADTYGGSGGATYSVAAMGDPASLQVAVHELGHTLIGLWDEYPYGLEGDPDGYISPNCAPQDRPVSWGAWLDAGPIDWEAWHTIQELPPRQRGDTACDGRDGAVSADMVCAYPTCSFSNWVRPTAGSCMMYALQDGYCPVCQEDVIKALYKALDGHVVTSADPEVGSKVVVDEGQEQLFTVDVAGPADGLQWTWTNKGKTVGTGPDFVLDGDQKVCGELTLTVEDLTAWVRDDPDGLLVNTATWDVRTGPCCGCATGGPSPGAALLFLVPLVALRRRRAA